MWRFMRVYLHAQTSVHMHLMHNGYFHCRKNLGSPVYICGLIPPDDIVGSRYPYPLSIHWSYHPAECLTRFFWTTKNGIVVHSSFVISSMLKPTVSLVCSEALKHSAGIAHVNLLCENVLGIWINSSPINFYISGVEYLEIKYLAINAGESILKGVLHLWALFLKTLCIFSKNKATSDKVSYGSGQKYSKELENYSFTSVETIVVKLLWKMCENQYFPCFEP